MHFLKSTHTHFIDMSNKKIDAIQNMLQIGL